MKVGDECTIPDPHTEHVLALFVCAKCPPIRPHVIQHHDFPFFGACAFQRLATLHRVLVVQHTRTQQLVRATKQNEHANRAFSLDGRQKAFGSLAVYSSMEYKDCSGEKL